MSDKRQFQNSPSELNLQLMFDIQNNSQNSEFNSIIQSEATKLHEISGHYLQKDKQKLLFDIDNHNDLQKRTQKDYEDELYMQQAGQSCMGGNLPLQNTSSQISDINNKNNLLNDQLLLDEKKENNEKNSEISNNVQSVQSKKKSKLSSQLNSNKNNDVQVPDKINNDLSTSDQGNIQEQQENVISRTQVPQKQRMTFKLSLSHNPNNGSLRYVRSSKLIQKKKNSQQQQQIIQDLIKQQQLSNNNANNNKNNNNNPLAQISPNLKYNLQNSMMNNVENKTKMQHIRETKQVGKMQRNLTLFIKIARVMRQFLEETASRRFKNLSETNFKSINDLAFSNPKKNDDIFNLFKQDNTQRRQILIRQNMNSSLNQQQIYQLAQQEDTEDINPSMYQSCKKFCQKRIDFLNKKLSKMPILFPNHPLVIIINILMLIVIVLNIYLFSIDLAFQNPDLSYKNIQSIIFFVSFFMYIVHVFMQINVAYYFKGRIITSRNQIIQHYRSQLLLSDIIGFIVILIKYILRNQSNIYINLIEFIYIVEIKTLRKLIIRIERLYLNAGKSSNLYAILKLWGYLFVLSHFIGVFWHGLAIFEKQILGKNDTWIDSYELVNEEWYVRYIYSYYWATALVMLIGTSGSNFIEVIFTTLTLLLTVGFFGYIISEIQLILARLNEKQQNYQKDIKAINQYMNQRKFSMQLKGSIKNFLEYLYDCYETVKSNQEAENVLIKLTPILQDNIKQELAREILPKFTFLQEGFTKELTHQVQKILEEQLYIPSQAVFRQNKKDEDLAIYYLAQGEVHLQYNDLFKNKPAIIRKVKEGEIFGDYNFFTGVDYFYSALCTSPCTIYKISRKNFQKVIKNSEQDSEVFCHIRDDFFIRNYSFIYPRQCAICNQQRHQENDCKSINYNPNKYFLLQKYQYSPIITERGQLEKARNVARCNTRANLLPIEIAQGQFIENYENLEEKVSKQGKLTNDEQTLYEAIFNIIQEINNYFDNQKQNFDNEFENCSQYYDEDSYLDEDSEYGGSYKLEHDEEENTLSRIQTLNNLNTKSDLKNQKRQIEELIGEEIESTQRSDIQKKVQPQSDIMDLSNNQNIYPQTSKLDEINYNDKNSIQIYQNENKSTHFSQKAQNSPNFLPEGREKENLKQQLPLSFTLDLGRKRSSPGYNVNLNNDLHMLRLQKENTQFSGMNNMNSNMTRSIQKTQRKRKPSYQLYKGGNNQKPADGGIHGYSLQNFEDQYQFINQADSYYGNGRSPLKKTSKLVYFNTNQQQQGQNYTTETIHNYPSSYRQKKIKIMAQNTQLPSFNIQPSHMLNQSADNQFIPMKTRKQFVQASTLGLNMQSQPTKIQEDFIFIMKQFETLKNFKYYKVQNNFKQILSNYYKIMKKKKKERFANLLYSTKDGFTINSGALKGKKSKYQQEQIKRKQSKNNYTVINNNINNNNSNKNNSNKNNYQGNSSPTNSHKYNSKHKIFSSDVNDSKAYLYKIEEQKDH